MTTIHGPVMSCESSRMTVFATLVAMVLLAGGCSDDSSTIGLSDATAEVTPLPSSSLNVEPDAKPASEFQASLQPTPQKDLAPDIRRRYQQSHERMIEALDEVAHTSPQQNVYFGNQQASAARDGLKELSPSQSGPRRWGLEFTLGKALLYQGNEDEAIELEEKVYQQLRTNGAGGRADVMTNVAFELAVSYLRKAESANCCALHNEDSCIFPIQGKAVHTRPQYSQRAIELLEELLAHLTSESPIYWRARWLLNVAYMTIGHYPDQVPQKYVLSPDSFASDVDFPRFRNISSNVGLDSFTLSGGVIADDFDLDGDFDLLVSSYDPTETIRYFPNVEGHRFENKAEEVGLRGIRGGLNMIQADYDNDGNTDVLVLRGAWMAKYGRHPNSLLHNNGDGTFYDVAFAAGMGESFYPTQTAVWLDYDNDGHVDIYIGNETTPQQASPCQLFHNQGDGTFKEVAATAGVTNDRFTKAVVAGDYDKDGFPDLYVSNLDQPNRLYHNNGNGTFTDVATSAGVTHPLKSFPCWFWDFDNDGNLDIFVAAYAASVGDLAKYLAGESTDVERGRLYRGDGMGHFTDVALEFGLTQPCAPMGSNFGDLDNDGFLDMYLGTGYPEYWQLMPNMMYRNQQGKGFADITTAGGFGHLQKGHAISFVDLDHDGDQDVFEQMGGALFGDKYYDVLFENPGFDNHWISLHLVGTITNRAAIGAEIRVDIIEQGKPRSIYRRVGSGGSFGASPLRQHIGIGKASRIEQIEVYWPTSGTRQEFSNVAPDQVLRIVEGQPSFETMMVRRRNWDANTK